MRIFPFDLSKAFDSVSHRILVILVNLGMLISILDVDINPCFLNWFISFLSNRKTTSCCTDNMTVEYDITRGFSQGTVLGPIFIYCFP